MLNEEMLSGTNAEQSTNSDVTNVSPAIGNTDVVCSQSPPMTEYEIKVAKDFIWQHMTNEDKNLMIKMSSKEFIEHPDLRFYLTACVVMEGVATDLQCSRQ